jgi:alkylation response protein AidB-like acyl-CoA dehydrogenase
MKLMSTPEERSFREKARQWLRENVPKEERPASGPESLAFDRAWQRRQFDAGWAGIAWPKEYGGLGLSLDLQMVWLEEHACLGLPDADNLYIGLNHGGPTIILLGTAEQKSYFLPRILSGEDVWCQGFSEPGAGSDLAGIRTKGVVEGDHLVINGSKIWTSFAQYADWQELLIRTDPNSQKHRGLTWVICDMKLPGVEIRPIRDVLGRHHLNQVFYDNVRIPISNVVGKIGDGWNVAMATLGFERGTGLVHYQVGLARAVDRLIEKLWQSSESPDGELAARLASLRAEVAALRAMTYLNISRAIRGQGAGAEVTLAALYHSELEQRAARLGFDLAREHGLELRQADHDPAYRYLSSFPWTIFGGTSQIRRNIIGERLLGLARA